MKETDFVCAKAKTYFPHDERCIYESFEKG
jgi:hypothetical protein